MSVISMSKVIIFPTDTVYGIGTPIFDTAGISKIYEIKHRDRSKPLACLCANMEQIDSIAYIDEREKELIKKYLPGALTLICKAKPNVVDIIGYKTIGVRIPNNKIALDILKENGPMLTTSVNESGQVPLNEYDEIVKKYANLVDRIYNTNTVSSNISSTVVLCTEPSLKILRQGQIYIEN